VPSALFFISSGGISYAPRRGFKTGFFPGQTRSPGFIGLIRLENLDTGMVLAHEKTQAKPKADRLALMEACRANMSQIFSIYPDPEGDLSSIYERVFFRGSPQPGDP